MKSLILNESVNKVIIAEEKWNHSGILLETGNSYNIVVMPSNQTWSDGTLFPQVCNAS